MAGRPFVKGVSPNPGGRSKEQREREKLFARALRNLVGENCEEIAELLVKIARDTAVEPRDRVRASEVILIRTIGKPTEHVVVDEPTELTPEQIDEEERLIAMERLQRMAPEEKMRLLAGSPTETVQ